MSTVVFPHRVELSSTAGADALATATRFWFVVAVIGQWAFLYIIASFYGPSTLTGNFQAWNKNKLLLKGYVPGDAAGNLAFAAHVLLAAVIAFGGALQLVPQLRKRALWLHRWNGRLFLVTALGGSLSGLYMEWVRGSRMDMLSAVAITINALLIIGFGLLAWRTAWRRDVAGHRRWALRTYLVANGQWFTRVGFMAWMIINRGHDHGFFQFWGFGCYLVPLAFLELYLRAKEGGVRGERYAMSGALVVLTLLMGVGIFGMTMLYGKVLQ
jgi:hypothetical protein